MAEGAAPRRHCVTGVTLGAHASSRCVCGCARERWTSCLHTRPRAHACSRARVPVGRGFAAGVVIGRRRQSCATDAATAPRLRADSSATPRRTDAMAAHSGRCWGTLSCRALGEERTTANWAPGAAQQALCAVLARRCRHHVCLTSRASCVPSRTRHARHRHLAARWGGAGELTTGHSSRSRRSPAREDRWQKNLQTDFLVQIVRLQIYSPAQQRTGFEKADIVP